MANDILSLGMASAVCCVLGGLSLGAQSQTAEEIPHPLFDIPKMDKETVDGNAAGWGDGGFRVDALAPVDGFVAPEARLSARLRLGWNDKGLLVLVEAREASFTESANEKDLASGNNIELFMLDKCGGNQMIKATISAGMDPAHPELRYSIEDLRKDPALRKVAPAVTAARMKQEGGYSLEALLPWENLGIKPQVGAELAFQIWINDYVEGAPELHEIWYPATGIADAPDRAHRIRLAVAPSPPVRAAGRA